LLLSALIWNKIRYNPLFWIIESSTKPKMEKSGKVYSIEKVIPSKTEV